MTSLLIVLGILAVVWLAILVVVLATGRRVGRELLALLPNLLRLFRGLLLDRRVPRSSRLLLLVAVAWLASPIDLIPEFIPMAGPLDDAIVAALVLRHLVRTTDPAVIAEHWRGAPATLDRLLRLIRAPRASAVLPGAAQRLVHPPDDPP